MAIKYSYSNSLGETFSAFNDYDITREIISQSSVVNYIDGYASNFTQYVFSSTNSDTVSTTFNKTFKSTLGYRRVESDIILNKYNTYSISEDNGAYSFTFIKENSETEYFTLYNNNSITIMTYTGDYYYDMPKNISALDVSFSNRHYYTVLSDTRKSHMSDVKYLMRNGINASITLHSLYNANINYSGTNYDAVNVFFRLLSMDNNQYTSGYTYSRTGSLYDTVFLTTSSTTQSGSASTSSSTYYRTNSTYYITDFTYSNQYPYKSFIYSYSTTYVNSISKSAWKSTSTSKSQSVDTFTIQLKNQPYNTSALGVTSLPFIETTINTTLYDSDGYLQGYRIAGSIKSDNGMGTYLFFGTSILDTNAPSPWNNVSAFGSTISSKSVIVYYNNSNNTDVVSYETSAVKTTITDENGVTESINFSSFRYLPQVSYLSMNWIGTSYKGLGSSTQDNITTYTYISTYAFSDAESYSSVILASTVNGDCYEYYTTYTTYKYIEGVTTYDYSEYTESAIKTTYSTSITSSTALNDYNYSYKTETRYDSNYSDNDYITTRLETIFSETIYRNSFSYSSITYVSSKFGHGTDVSTMEDISSSSTRSFSASNKNGYTMLDSTMYMNTASELKSDSVLETRLNQQVKTYSTQSIVSNTTTSITTDGIDGNIVLMQYSEPVTFSGSFIVSDNNNSLYTTSSYYNTTDFGTTFRNSSMVSSTEIININNEYLTMDRVFNYNITSAWAYKDVMDIISTYNTVLQTTFKISYDTRTNSNSYKYTNIATTTAYGTSDRFMNLVGISRTSTYTVYNTNTIAYYNGSTMATINNMSSKDTPSTVSSSSVINYTFITSIDDYSSSTDLASTKSSSLANKQFMNSITQLVSSTMEQQNDTLVFKSEIATYSTFRLSTSFSTSSTININYEATTYTDEYNPISYTTTSMAVTSSLTASNSIESVTASSTVTQAVNYTPIYSTVNGVYITG